MAGAMRKMAVYLGLVEDDQYDDEFYDQPGDAARDNGRDTGGTARGYSSAGERYGSSSSSSRYADRAGASDTVRVTEAESDGGVATRRRPVSASRVGGSAAAASSTATRDWRNDTVAQEPVTSHPAGSRIKAGARAGARPAQITTVQPRSYNDARRIGEEFRSDTPVIINLTELTDTDAKRIVDFAAGLVFGLRGSIERITNKVFLLSPANVDVGDAARAQVAQDGLVNRR